MGTAYKLSFLIVFATIAPLDRALAQEQWEATLELVRSKDALFRWLLSAPQPQAVIANEEVRKDGAEWIRRIVRPDWLPSGIEQRLEPQRRHFGNGIPTAIYDIFHLKVSLDHGALDIYEGHEFCIIWRDNDIVLGDEVEKQIRLCLRAVLKGYSGDGKFVMKSHENGRVVSGTISGSKAENWGGIIWFWMGEGVLFVTVWEAPSIESRPVGILDTDERAVGPDQLRFDPKPEGK